MALDMEVGLGSGDIVLDGAQVPLPTQKGGTAPNSRPMSIVAKRSPISPTAELLYILHIPVNSKKCQNRHRKGAKS